MRHLSHVGICSQMYSLSCSSVSQISSLSCLRACVHNMRSLSCCGSLSQLWGLSAAYGKPRKECEVSRLVSCIHSCQLSEIFLDMSIKGKFHEQFWSLSRGYISESFGGLCLRCEDSELFGDMSLGCEISKPFGVCVQDVRSQRHLGSVSQGMKSLN